MDRQNSNPRSQDGNLSQRSDTQFDTYLVQQIARQSNSKKPEYILNELYTKNDQLQSELTHARKYISNQMQVKDDQENLIIKLKNQLSKTIEDSQQIQLNKFTTRDQKIQSPKSKKIARPNTQLQEEIDRLKRLLSDNIDDQKKSMNEITMERQIYEDRIQTLQAEIETFWQGQQRFSTAKRCKTSGDSESPKSKGAKRSQSPSEKDWRVLQRNLNEQNEKLEITYEVNNILKLQLNNLMYQVKENLTIQAQQNPRIKLENDLKYIRHEYSILEAQKKKQEQEFQDRQANYIEQIRSFQNQNQVIQTFQSNSKEPVDQNIDKALKKIVQQEGQKTELKQLLKETQDQLQSTIKQNQELRNTPHKKDQSSDLKSTKGKNQLKVETKQKPQIHIKPQSPKSINNLETEEAKNMVGLLIKSVVTFKKTIDKNQQDGEEFDDQEQYIQSSTAPIQTRPYNKDQISHQNGIEKIYQGGQQDSQKGDVNLINMLSDLHQLIKDIDPIEYAAYQKSKQECQFPLQESNQITQINIVNGQLKENKMLQQLNEQLYKVKEVVNNYLKQLYESYFSNNANKTVPILEMNEYYPAKLSKGEDHLNRGKNIENINQNNYQSNNENSNQNNYKIIIQGEDTNFNSGTNYNESQNDNSSKINNKNIDQNIQITGANQSNNLNNNQGKSKSRKNKKFRKSTSDSSSSQEDQDKYDNAPKQNNDGQDSQNKNNSSLLVINPEHKDTPSALTPDSIIVIPPPLIIINVAPVVEELKIINIVTVTAPPVPAAAPPPPPPPPPSRSPPPPPPPSKGPPVQVKYAGRPRKMPSIKVRQVIWIPIRQTEIQKSIWQDFDDTKIKLNFEYLEAQFDLQQVKKSTDPVVLKKEKISLLKPERNKNIELILMRLKTQNDIIIDSLFRIDRKVLTQPYVESLLNCVPQETEKDLYDDKQIDLSVLSQSDLFIIEMLKVKESEKRLKALQFEYVFDEWQADVKTKIILATSLIEKTRKDEPLKTLLLYILAFGNFLNGESQRGDAYGFKLDFLDRLPDMKTDDKQSIMVYLIKQCEIDQQEEVVLLDEQYDDYSEQAKMPIQQIQVLINEMNNGISDVLKAIESQTQNSNDRVGLEFKVFYEQSSQTLNQIKKDYQILEVKYQGLCVYYGESLSRLPSDQFFAKILKFKQFCKVCKISMQKQQASLLKESIKLDMKQSKTQSLKPLPSPNGGRPSQLNLLQIPGLSRGKTSVSNLDQNQSGLLRVDDQQIKSKSKRASRIIQAAVQANSFIQAIQPKK